MKAVVNATPLIVLSLIDQFDLLRRLFDEILVPPAVYHEVAVQGRNHPGAAALAAADWIQIRAPQSTSTIEPILLGLDIGELQVLLLACEVTPDWEPGSTSGQSRARVLYCGGELDRAASDREWTMASGPRPRGVRNGDC